LATRSRLPSLGCDDRGFDNARKIAFLGGREKRLNEIGGAP
jgi:hypothetical protein